METTRQSAIVLVLVMGGLRQYHRQFNRSTASYCYCFIIIII